MTYFMNDALLQRELMMNIQKIIWLYNSHFFVTFFKNHIETTAVFQ